MLHTGKKRHRLTSGNVPARMLCYLSRHPFHLQQLGHISHPSSSEKVKIVKDDFDDFCFVVGTCAGDGKVAEKKSKK